MAAREAKALRAVRWATLVVAICVVSACGGGGGGGDAGGGEGSGPPPSVPATLVITAPEATQALGATVVFSASANDPALTYRWDFGDGTTSTLAAPTHAYSRAGVFAVRLVVGNGAGSLASTASVAVADFATVAGKACSGAEQSGWCWQRPLPQGDAIADYAFVDDMHGWAVGDGGTVVATVDGGLTWNAQRSGTTLPLGEVVFVDALVGWVASGSGELLKTADGGASWQRASFGHNDDVRHLGAASATTAWVMTTTGEAFVTTSGGAQWRTFAPPPGGAFRIVPVSATDVWALTPFYDAQPSLSHSVDGGATWLPVALPAIEPGLAGYSYELQFIDADRVLLAGYESGYTIANPTTYLARQTLRITADRGASWQAVALPPAAANPVFSLVDGRTVFAFSYGSALQLTRDDGATWETVPLPGAASNAFIAFKAFSPLRLLATDVSGQVWLSIDGGAHWNARAARGLTTASVNSLWFFDSREGVAFADDGSAARTTDGGQTWRTTGSAGYGWRRAQFLADGSVGWIVSDAGAIYRSTDRGRTWLAPAAGAGISLFGVTDFCFIDATHGFAVRPYASGSDGTIFRTADGGQSWQSVPDTSHGNGFVALRFADALNGVAVGPAGIALVSSDGGATWAPRPTGAAANLRRVAFLDATTAVAVGDDGTVVRSTDRGQSWQPVANPARRSLNDVRFVDARIGYAVGDGGTVIVSRDGGLTWSLQQTGAQASLQAAFFTDEQTGWIAGADGSILATATGGR